MTREYALKELYFAINDLAESYESYYYSDSLEHLINSIYDGFESRTCKNCKYWGEDETCWHLVYEKYLLEGYEEESNMTTEKYFGCNKFERKDK